MSAGTSNIRGRRWLPAVVFIVGLAVTAAVTFQLRTSATDRYQQQRNAEVEEVAVAIEFRMDTYVQSLTASAALFEASDEVTSEEFNTFVASLGVLGDLPGIQALGWNRLVPAADVPAYEQEIRERHAFLPADFAVRPVINNDDLMVVEYLQPLAGNETAFGFNILGEELRAAAVQRSRATNAAAATAPINLIQDDETVPGMLVLLPTSTNLGDEGMSVAVFRTTDLLTATELDIRHTFIVQDVGAAEEAYEDPTTLSRPGQEIDSSTQVELSVYGRRWLVSLVDDGVGAPSWLGLILGAASGIALAGALAWLVLSSQNAAERADRKAASLTAELVTTNQTLAVVGSRLERGIRSADILVWESNLTTGETWSSADPEHPEAGIEDSFEERLHPDDRDMVGSIPDPAPGKTREYEFRLADRNGQYRRILSRSQGVMRGKNHVVIGAHIDITDQHDHVLVVEGLNKDLTERNQSLRDFTHVASHDLRSPLRAVGSLVSFLREDLPDDLAEDAEHHLRRIDERVLRMSTLIDDLLVYASAHNRDESIELTDIGDVVEVILRTIEVPESLTIVVDCDIAPVHINRTPFSMCVRNLIDNAIKHHDKSDGRVTITAYMLDGRLHLEVNDDGPGIDPAYLPKVFEPFRRLRADEATPGSGIGLSVIERSTAAHGATINAQSTVGEGSTFTIRWPVGSGQTLQSDVESPPAPSLSA